MLVGDKIIKLVLGKTEMSVEGEGKKIMSTLGKSPGSISVVVLRNPEYKGNTLISPVLHNTKKHVPMLDIATGISQASDGGSSNSSNMSSIAAVSPPAQTQPSPLTQVVA